MPLNDDAPLFFASGLSGITPDGLNVVLTFAAPVPSADHTSCQYRPNVRIVMSSPAVKQMVEFLQKVERQSGEVTHQMPQTAQ